MLETTAFGFEQLRERKSDELVQCIILAPWLGCFAFLLFISGMFYYYFNAL